MPRPRVSGTSSSRARRADAGPATSGEQETTARPPTSPKRSSGSSGSSTRRAAPGVRAPPSARHTASPPSADVVNERRERSRLPEERDEPSLALEIERRRNASDFAVASLVLGSGERDRRRCRPRTEQIALAPAAWERPANVLDEAHGADDRGRVDRAAVRLVVERDVPGHDREARAPRTRPRCPSIASASSHPISGFSGLPKLRQSVKPSGSPPAHATLRAASSTASCPAEEGVEAGDPPLTVERKQRARATTAAVCSTAASSPGRRTVREPTSWS